MDFTAWVLYILGSLNNFPENKTFKTIFSVSYSGTRLTYSVVLVNQIILVDIVQIERHATTLSLVCISGQLIHHQLHVKLYHQFCQYNCFGVINTFDSLYQMFGYTCLYIMGTNFQYDETLCSNLIQYSSKLLDKRNKMKVPCLHRNFFR